MHGRHRQRRPGAGRLRRPQCARRNDRRVFATRLIHSGQEPDARRRQDPRRRKPRHAGVGVRAADFRQPRRHHRSARGRADRRALRRVGRARRPGDRDQPHPQSARLHRRQRHRARSRGRAHGDTENRADQADCGNVPVPSRRHARFRDDPVALSRVCASPRARRQERSEPGVAAAASDCDRPAADQCPGRYHQLHDLRPRPPAARVRRREGEGQSRGASCPRRRDPHRARRQDLHARRQRVRDRRRARRRVARRHHGRRGERMFRTNNRRSDRVGAVGPDQHRPHRPQARDQFRRALPVRARRRPGFHGAGTGARDPPGARPVWWRAVGHHGCRRSDRTGARHRLSAERSEAPGGPRREPGRYQTDPRRPRLWARRHGRITRGDRAVVATGR